MTGAEKIADIMKQVNDIKAKIQEKYDRVMAKVDLIQQEILKLEENVNNSIMWVEAQKAKLEAKMKKLMQDIQDWMNLQLQKAQEWLDGVKKEIEDFILELALSMLKALA